MVFVPPTLLSLTGTGFDLSDYSLRGLTASLAPIAQSAQIDRDINGDLMDLSVVQFRRYRVEISCTDQESPGFAAVSSTGEGVWPGSLVQVVLLPQLGDANAITLNMMVTEPWQESQDEWAADVSWSLVLEEA